MDCSALITRGSWRLALSHVLAAFLCGARSAAVKLDGSINVLLEA